VQFVRHKTYLTAFRKPFFVGLPLLQVLAEERGIKIVGFWPKDHPNAPRVGPPNQAPYTHLIAGKVVGETVTIEDRAEVAWIVALDRPATPMPFTVRRKAG
jgi:hypothetical protein